MTALLFAVAGVLGLSAGWTVMPIAAFSLAAFVLAAEFVYRTASPDRSRR